MARLLLLVAVLLLASVSAIPSWESLDETYTFDEFIEDYGKSYDDEEKVRRQTIFEKNLRLVLEHNSRRGSSHVLGVNHMMDLEPHEVPGGYDKSFHELWSGGDVATSDRVLKNHRMDLPFEIDDVSTLPNAVDWRAHGNVVTPVKTQGYCGSCWAFSSTAVLETHLALKTGVLYSLGVQQLVSCAPNPRHCGGRGGCTGSTGYLAMDYVASAGIVQEWQMGYQSYFGQNVNCTVHNRTGLLRGKDTPYVEGAVASIEGYAVVPHNNYTTMMNAVAKAGPLVVAVSSAGWHFYQGGIFTQPDDALSYNLNHAVVLMGYGTDQETGEDYWLIRNSHGPRWGEDGYIRIKRVDPATLDDPDSDCGMDYSPSFGEACTIDKDGNTIRPPAAKVCGTSGVLFDGVFPVGVSLL